MFTDSHWDQKTTNLGLAKKQKGGNMRFSLIYPAFFITFFLLILAYPIHADEGAPTNDIVVLEKAVHFLTADGSDVVVKPGTYRLEEADEWLRLIPGERRDALLLEAESSIHEGAVSEPTAISVLGEEDEHILALLLTGGQSLQAIGSYSGIRSRAGVSAARARARALRIAREMANRMGTRPPVREWSSLLFGGGGGNRSLNLDCGSRGVMVGAFGKVDGWITQLGLTCQSVNSRTGALGADFTRGPVGGVGGREKAQARCPENHVAVGFRIATGSYVHHIQFLCGLWDAREKRVREEDISFLPADNPIFRLFGAPHNFGSGDLRRAAFGCSPGKVGKALRGRHGSSMDSVRFVCDDWNR